VPQTDLMELCPPETRREFDRLFMFAMRRGVVNAGDAGHYGRRYATDSYAVRREIELKVAGTISGAHGAIATFDDVKGLLDYPQPTLPKDPTAHFLS